MDADAAEAGGASAGTTVRTPGTPDVLGFSTYRILYSVVTCQRFVESVAVFGGRECHSSVFLCLTRY